MTVKEKMKKKLKSKPVAEKHEGSSPSKTPKKIKADGKDVLRRMGWIDRVSK